LSPSWNSYSRKWNRAEGKFVVAEKLSSLQPLLLHEKKEREDVEAGGAGGRENGLEVAALPSGARCFKQ
jgi:hypothetical protein